MQKRGQVSVFAIIGIVAIAAVVLIFVLFKGVEEKARGVRDTEEYLESQVSEIKKEVDECIGSVSNDVLDRLYQNGGHLNPVRYADYYGKHIEVLCYRLEDEACYNMMFTKEEIMEQVLPVFEREIPLCIDNKLDAFREKDYEVSTGEFSLNADEIVFDDNAIVVGINYPITLTKDNFEETQDTFVVAVNTKFWQAAEIARSITNRLALGEEVDIPGISSSNIYFEIGRTSYADGNVYMIKERNGGKILYFAAET